MLKSLFCPALVMLSSLFLHAADAPPLMTVPGKLLFEDDFSRSEPAPKWRSGLGFWSVKDGVLNVAENPADKHGAYAFAMPGFTYKDIIAEFSFKLDGAKSCDLKIDDNTYKGSHAGHIARVSFTPTAVFLGDSKFGTMENRYYEKSNAPGLSPEEKKKLQATIKDKYATFPHPLDVSQWHQARVELIGDEMLASIDGKVVGYLKAEGINHPLKNLLGFTIGGQTALIDNVKVWEATASAAWAAKRAEIVGALTKKP